MDKDELNKHKFVQKVAKVDFYCMGLSMFVLSCFGQFYGLLCDFLGMSMLVWVRLGLYWLVWASLGMFWAISGNSLSVFGFS